MRAGLRVAIGVAALSLVLAVFAARQSGTDGGRRDRALPGVTVEAPAAGPTASPAALSFVGTEPRSDVVVAPGQSASVTVAWITTLHVAAELWVTSDDGREVQLGTTTHGSAVHKVTAPRTYRFTLYGPGGKARREALAETVIRVHQR